MSDIFVDPVTKDIYYIEQRASEGGRYVLLSNQTQTEVFAKDFNARTRVHEYGGAAAIAYNGTVYSSNFKDFLVYAAKDGKIKPITPGTYVNTPNYNTVLTLRAQRIQKRSIATQISVCTQSTLTYLLQS
jgi:hypothetical protein